MIDDLKATLTRWRREPASIPLAFAATTLSLLGAYVLKAGCLTHVWDGHQYRRLCYNDIQPLFFFRGIEAGLVPYADVQLEYPPLTGMFMDLVGKALRWLVEIGGVEAATNVTYFQLTAALLVPFAFATTFIIRRHTTAGRLMIWALGTPLILYAFHNWDLLVVAAAMWGLIAHERGSRALAGTALGVGASTKLYPAFFFPPMAADRIAAGDRKGLLRLTIAAAVAFVAINLPWVIAASGIPPVLDRPDWLEVTRDLELRRPDTNGWLGIWTFHASRYPDFGTVWYWVAHHGRALYPSDFWRVPGAGEPSGYRDLVSVASFVLFSAAVVMFVMKGWRRRGEAQGYPVAAVGLGIITSFLLVSKVHSPQYALWLAPLLALLDVRLRYVLAYFAADLGVFVSGFYWFTVMESPAPAWHGIFEVAVLSRAAALAGLAYAAFGAARIVPGTPSPEISSRPGSSLS